MYLDISSMKDESLGGRRHWAMLVDEATRCKHSFLLKEEIRPSGNGQFLIEGAYR